MADHPGPATRPSLLLRLRDPRDVAAWSTFVDVYGPLVYAHGRRRGLQHSDAEDVTQKVFLRVSQALRDFNYRPEAGRFRDWLGTIVRNEVYRHLNKEQTAARGQGGPEAPAALELTPAPAEDTEWSAEFKAHILQVALSRVRPRFEEPTWKAFEAVWVDHQAPPAVASAMNQTLQWVYVAKSRVLKQVWAEVQELADDTALLQGLMG